MEVHFGSSSPPTIHKLNDVNGGFLKEERITKMATSRVNKRTYKVWRVIRHVEDEHTVVEATSAEEALAFAKEQEMTLEWHSDYVLHPDGGEITDAELDRDTEPAKSAEPTGV